jgi:hypothetical protein
MEAAFPGLVGKRWIYKSPFDDTYQCIAWAAGDTFHKWWPVYYPPICYWPDGAPLDETVNGFVWAFEMLGYERTDTRDFEFGYQKVAIYAKDTGMVTHMARQHFFGRGWLSKPGDLEDIVHPDLECIEGDPAPFAPGYGVVAQILKRNWWTAANNGLFNIWWAAFRFWLYRLKGKLRLF